MSKNSRPRGPLVFPNGDTAFKRGEHWHYRRKGTRHSCEMSDRALAAELESRGYRIQWPVHTCVDTPGVTCGGCEQDPLTALNSFA
jgi:hypothetical protein